MTPSPGFRRAEKSPSMCCPPGIELDAICGNAALASLSHWLAATVLLQQLKVGKEKIGEMQLASLKLCC